MGSGPDFTFDTSGIVPACIPTVDPAILGPCGFHDLSPLEQGYTAAALEEFSDRLSAALAAPLFVGFSDLAPETLAEIRKDCAAFGDTWRVQEPERGFATGIQGGRDFWWLRNNRELTHPPFPPLTVTLGDDGKVRFEGAQGATDVR